jgi:hypothetical protein
MHANDDSLGVRSASVSGSDAEGRPFEVRQSARPTFFIWPLYNPVLKFSEVSRGVAGGLHNSRGSDRRSVCGISRYTKVLFATKVELHRKKSAT